MKENEPSTRRYIETEEHSVRESQGTEERSNPQQSNPLGADRYLGVGQERQREGAHSHGTWQQMKAHSAGRRDDR